MTPPFLQGAEEIGHGTYSTVYRIPSSLWNKIRPPGSKATSHPTLALKEEPTSSHATKEIEIHKRAEACTDGVPKIYGSFRRGDKTYIAMEDLRGYHELNALDAPTYAKILLIVKKLHACGIVHADIFPRNVMVRGSTVKIIDFGLSYFGDDGNMVNGMSLEHLVYERLEKAVDDRDVRALDRWLSVKHGRPRDAMSLAIRAGWADGVKHLVDSGAFDGEHLTYDMMTRAERSRNVHKILAARGLV